MSERKQHSSDQAGEATAATDRRPLWVWLDAAPVAWLVLVISAYGLLATAEMVPTKRAVPGLPEADRLALPFLVLTVCAGIIRYYCVRAQERGNLSMPRPNSRRRDNA